MAYSCESHPPLQAGLLGPLSFISHSYPCTTVSVERRSMGRKRLNGLCNNVSGIYADLFQWSASGTEMPAA